MFILILYYIILLYIILYYIILYYIILYYIILYYINNLTCMQTDHFSSIYDQFCFIFPNVTAIFSKKLDF